MEKNGCEASVRNLNKSTLSRIGAFALETSDIIWVGSTRGVTTANEEIMRLHSGTILFEKTSAGIPTDVMGVLEAEMRDLRIIGLSLDNNEISLYHHKHQTVGDTGDLLQFVLG